MNLAPIAMRLQDEVPALKLTGGAAEFERATQQLAAMPAAFVLPASETGEASPFMSQIVQQNVLLQFVVLIAVRNLSDDDGTAAVESLDPIRNAVRDALLNWTPEGAEQGCEFRAGAMLRFSNGVLWWQDTYATAYIIRSV